MQRFEEKVILCAHRGERLRNIENTMIAFRMVVEAGADMVETDVRMTKDGHLVLMHDESVDRTTDKTGRICDMTLEEFRSCNATFHAEGFSFEPPATLKELLDFALEHPKLLLNIEFKDYPTPGNEEFAYTCCDKIVDMLLSYGVQDRTWINSFDGRLLEHVYRRCGKQFHYHGFYPWFILGPMTIDPEEFIDVACMQHRYISESGEVVKYDEPLCPKEWFDYLHEKGITTLVAPSLKEYPKYDLTISWGAQIVCHDDPYAMLEHLRKNGLHE
ncbi:MAG: hypothetical protein IJX01_03260 [Oscillospiraceae bacterium]|nr:hypothetical protein [Oscillospiraceae bacterium]